MAFMGEMMECVMCSKQKRSNPNVESNWTLIQVDSQGFYVCPRCLQDSKHARKFGYQYAYERVLRKIISIVNGAS